MTSNPPPEPAPESNAAMWLALGRLQSDVARLIEGQSDLSHRSGWYESEDRRDQSQDGPAVLRHHWRRGRNHRLPRCPSVAHWIIAMPL